MKPIPRIALWAATGLASSIVALATLTGASASSNTQVILSATGITTSVGPATAGFWIWSQPGGNAYGNQGAGSIYFYTLLPAEHPVDVSNVVVSVSAKTVSETVASTDGLITCNSFTGTETSPGVGTVSFTCTVAGHTGDVTATNVPAQVNISSVP